MTMTKEELKAKAEALYPIHEDDLSLIRNIREYEQNAFIKGYELAKKELGWHPYPEEKPEEEARVWVNIKGKYFESRIFSEGSFGMVDRAVIAWMPLLEYTPKE